jgi:hypothetical protein
MSIPHQTTPAPGHGYDQGHGGYPQQGGYPPQGYGYGYGGYGPGPAPAPTNGLAVAALVLGIVGLLGGIIPILGWFASPFALAAVGFGFAGLGRAKTAHKGKGMSIAGLVTGFLALAAITAWTVWLVVGQANHTADLYSGEALFGCDTTESVFEDSVEEFRDVEGREPTSEDELIEQGHLNFGSDDFDVEIIDRRAEVVEQPGGEC